jgi:hypothetical protein
MSVARCFCRVWTGIVKLAKELENMSPDSEKFSGLAAG